MPPILQRLFLFAARRGRPLPQPPAPTHHFPYRELGGMPKVDLGLLTLPQLSSWQALSVCSEVRRMGVWSRGAVCVTSRQK